MRRDHIHLHRHARGEGDGRAFIDRRRQPFIQTDQMAGVQGHVEQIKRQRLAQFRPDRPAMHARGHHGAPARHRRDIGAGKDLQIVPCRVGQVIRPMRQPARAADVRAPVTDVERRRLALFQELARRPGQPRCGACGKGRVAPQGQPADMRRLIGRKVADAVLEGKDHPPQGRRRHVVGKLQPGNPRRIDLAAQPATGVHHQVGDVFHLGGAGAQRVGDERRQVECCCRVRHLGRREPFPADGADGAFRHRFVDPITQRPARARLRRQGQAGAQAGLDVAGLNQWRNRGVGQPFIPRQQGRRVARHDQQRLFKARVKAAQPLDIRRMFAVAVNDHRLQPPPLHRRP